MKNKLKLFYSFLLAVILFITFLLINNETEYIPKIYDFLFADNENEELIDNFTEVFIDEGQEIKLLENTDDILDKIVENREYDENIEGNIKEKDVEVEKNIDEILKKILKKIDSLEEQLKENNTEENFKEESEVLKRFNNLPDSPIYLSENIKNKIALTFNLIEGKINTGIVLDILRKRDIKVDVFIDPDFAFLNSELISQIIYDGHNIACFYESSLDDLAIKKVLSNDDDFFENFGIFTKPLIRTNSLEFSSYKLEEFNSNKYKLIFWNIDANNISDIEEITIKKLKQETISGSIVNFDLNSEETINILPEYIRWLRERGFEIVKLEELF